MIHGLGRTGDAVTVFPTTAPSVEPDRLAAASPQLEYRVHLFSAGKVTVTCSLVPTHPIRDGQGLRLAVGLDDQAPQLLSLKIDVGSNEWSQAVLNATETGSVNLNVAAPGSHVIKLYMVDPGVVVDKIVLDAGGLRPSYLGPAETRVRH